MTLTSARLLVQTTAIAVRATIAAAPRVMSQGTRTAAQAALWLCVPGTAYPAVVLLHARSPLRAGAREDVAAGRVRAVAAVRVPAATAVIVTARGLTMGDVAVLISAMLVGKTHRVKGVPSLHREIEEGTHSVQRRVRRSRTRVARRWAYWTRRHGQGLRRRPRSFPVFPRFDVCPSARSLLT